MGPLLSRLRTALSVVLGHKPADTQSFVTKYVMNIPKRSGRGGQCPEHFGIFVTWGEGSFNFVFTFMGSEAS